ncbi:MAG: ATP synthase F1 subunit gamma [Deltaproteobacteria bacterium]|jgi:F-type H+-transporting ATPase subunit gamma|nr:ATP synthase F1 subunit gamma [Deltaproteobacteria bacterium]MBW2535087.1 ATP synthase F1 subunit gamma [Deltaproteobacteria bacterium]
MPSLKDIRKRIASVKSTQKITRAMKMVAGARLNRAQQRILELRPYAIKTHQVLAEITDAGRVSLGAERAGEASAGAAEEAQHPLLVFRPEKRVMLVVLTSDRGLCGSFNTNINKLAEAEWHRREEEGQEVKMLVIGRKGRDYFSRRGAPMEYLPGVWDDLGWDSARKLGRHILQHFLGEKDSVDAIYFVYNEFKSAIQQRVAAERLLPVPPPDEEAEAEEDGLRTDFLFEPDETGLLQQLVPMYVQVSILRALYESMASELGARMTAMDSATNNASEMIAKLTLQYNRARQAAITTELMEIISGAEALKG